MLSADSDGDIRTCLMSQFNCQLHQLADSILIQFCKRIVLQNLLVVVCL